MTDPPVFIAIVGPTCSGKTDLSLEIAMRLGGEIISMDSRQVYRGMDVGTDKVSKEDRERVPHHGLDLLEPDQAYSAGQFAREAREWIDGIRERLAAFYEVGDAFETKTQPFHDVAFGLTGETIMGAVFVGGAIGEEHSDSFVSHTGPAGLERPPSETPARPSG